MNHVTEKDNDARNRIVAQTDQNFFVEAGAGSGKTTMLVNRMVAMVEQGKDISKICAITFTKAAASEFYSRFQKELIRRSRMEEGTVLSGYAGELPLPTEVSRKRCAEALKNIDLCFMGTIDSFCQMILAEHPFEAGVPSDTTILSEEEIGACYRQMYVKICAGEYGEELANAGGAFQALHRNAEDVFVKGMRYLMDRRNVEFQYDEPQKTDLDKDFAQERQQLIRAGKVLLEHPEILYPKEANNLKSQEALPAAMKSIQGRWSSQYQGLLYGLKQIRYLRVLPEAMDRYGDVLEEFFEDHKKWWTIRIAEEGGIYQTLQNLRYDVSLSFLMKCVKIVEKELKEQGKLTFFDELYFLRNMLQADAAKGGTLIRYIYNRHSYFLIDEFQDTNPMQAEIFFYLTAKEAKSDWRECIPKEGSLFIVGDPKQSIYRFRSADVASFLKVKDLFYGERGDVLYLSRNFRSTRMLCGYFNRVFQSLLPVQTKEQSKFEEIPLPKESAGEFQGIFRYKAYTGKSVEEHPDETDPVQIGRIIQRLVDQEAYLIRDKKEKTLRRIRYEDIMVITYGKNKLEGIKKELDRLDIPTKVEGKVPFETNEALIDIVRIYRAVADPGDKMAEYGALTSALFGCTREEILHEKEYGEDLQDPVCMLVKEQKRRLEQIRQKAVRLSPAALFSLIMEDLEVYRALPAENMEILFYTLELLRKEEKDGTVVSHRDGAEYLDTLLGGASSEERCLRLSEHIDCVHMANLHKVKGLEAPVVILAAASAKNGNTPTGRVVHEGDGSRGYLFRLEKERNVHGGTVSYFETSQYQEEEEEEKEALKAEELRLIYVAATRARNALILCQSVYMSRGKEIVDTKWNPLLDAGTPDFFLECPEAGEKPVKTKEEVLADALYEKAALESVLTERSSEEKTIEVKNPSHVKMPSKFEEESAEQLLLFADPDTDQEGTEQEGAGAFAKERTGSVHQYAALLGTMTHRLMEMLVVTGNNLDVPLAVEEILKDYSLLADKTMEKKMENALLEVANVIRNGGYEQTNKAPKDILHILLEAEECYCEVPFCYQDPAEGKNTIWNGVMDVIYKKDGQWHILDYKTNLDGSNLDEKYKEQLEAYKKAFLEVRKEEVADALTYHIDI